MNLRISKNVRAVYAGLSLILISNVLADDKALDLYVAVDGSDTNPGTATQPFATLEKARDALRSEEAHDGGATVHVGAGTYFMTEPFRLGEQDSGTDAGGIVYRAEGNARLMGGRLVPIGKLQLVDDPAIKARLPEVAHGQVRQINLEALGIENTGPFPEIFRDGGGIIEVFYGGKRMPISRWPNEGYTTIQVVLDSGVWAGNDLKGGTFRYRGDRPERWLKAVDEGLWLKGFWRVPWQPETVRVAAISPEEGTIKQATAVGGGLGSKYTEMVNGTRRGSGKENWYALNLLEELDRPGEWCLHFPTKTLFFWPPEEENDASLMIADMKEPLVVFDGVDNMTFRGFILEGGLGDGASITGGEGVTIAGCQFRNFGGTGVTIREGRNHRVISCDLHHLGQGGIYVAGGDRPTLTPAGHEVLNNHIHHIGQVQTTYAPAIKLGGSFDFEAVGCRAAHNLIHDLPHAAVLYGGNENIFEFNEIWRVAQDSGDVGAFYTWHDWTSRGNILRYNLVADSLRCNAFYMDDGDSGDTVTGNIVWSTHYGPFIGGGHDNIVSGNLLIDCEGGGLHLDDRGVARNYTRHNKNLMSTLERMHHTSPPWSEQYPAMLKLLAFHPDYPTGNEITGNVLIDSPVHVTGENEHLQYTTIKDNPVKSREDAGLPIEGNPIPALRQMREIHFPDVPGFKPIPIAEIGLYLDEFRQSLPEIANSDESDKEAAFDSMTDVEHTK